MITTGVGRSPLVGVVGWPQATNEMLGREWRELGVRAAVLSPVEAVGRLRRGDIGVGRIDVLESLDGVQPGLETLDALEARGVRVVNGGEALLNAHDKLRTARLLDAARLPHPATACVRSVEAALDVELPLVIKPRFGSWGRDVVRCESREEVIATFALIASKPWFRRHGAIAQQLIASPGFDLRLIVANGEVVGATERVAPPGEWRTNVALGGTRRAACPSDVAKATATAAAEVVTGNGLVGVDLLPVAGGYVVLELNGAVEFDRAYDIDGRNVFAAAASALGLRPPADNTVGRTRSAA